MEINWNEIKLIIFDLDGTLNETDDLYIERVLRWLKPFGRVFPNWDRKTFGRRFIMALETPGNLILSVPDRIGIDGLLDQWKQKIGLTGMGKKRHFRLVEGVRSMLEVAARDHEIAIATVRGQEVVDDFLDQMGLREHFSVIVHGLSTEKTKPDPAPIIFAAEAVGVLPNECLMVGDTTVDMIAGKRAGAKTIGVLCGFGEEKELIRAGADLLLNSTTDLIDLLA